MSSPENQIAEDTAEETSAGTFLVRKVFLKDVSFEAPDPLAMFGQSEWNPDVDLQMDNTARNLEDDLYEVTLTATVTVRVADRVAYLVEVVQAGIFHVSGYPNERVKESLGWECPSILFPFVREVVTGLAVKGGFPQLLLAPMNFQALYRQQVDQRAE